MCAVFGLFIYYYMIIMKHIHPSMHACIFHAYIHTHTHIYIYIYIYIYISVCVCVWVIVKSRVPLGFPKYRVPQ